MPPGRPPHSLYETYRAAGSPVLHGLPPDAPPKLPYRLERPAPAPAVWCAIYKVSCVPGVTPARGRLSVAPSWEQVAAPSDYCRHGAASASAWLPPHVASERHAAARPARCTCPTLSLLPRRGEGVGAGSACTTETYSLLQCSEQPLLPPVLARSPPPLSPLPADGRSVDVLLATTDHWSHGLFAIVERVVNQVLHARASGLEPYVFVGELVWAEGTACEHGVVPYHDAMRGGNVWDYWFEQPGRYRPGDTHVGGRPIRSVQTVSPESLYHASAANRTQTYTGASAYDARGRAALRAAAHSLLANGSLVRPHIRRRADELFAPWRRLSGHVLGLHVRGTDKVVQKKVPPEAYFPFVDAWISAHPDALLFVATDEAAYYERIVARYGDALEPRGRRRGGRRAAKAGGGAGRVVSAGRGYDSANVITDAGLGGFAKGAEVLLDALLLSKCDFLLKSASAVAEYAMWANLALHTHHIDLQWEDRFHSQSLPRWAKAVGEDDARGYCAALKQGCRIDARQSSRARPGATLLQGGQSCARCLPRLDASSWSGASAATELASGARCADTPGARLLTQPECIALGRSRKLNYLGTQVERGEYPGCIVWAGRDVEFNAHADEGKGCNVFAKGGRCLCTRDVAA